MFDEFLRFAFELDHFGCFLILLASFQNRPAAALIVRFYLARSFLDGLIEPVIDVSEELLFFS